METKVATLAEQVARFKAERFGKAPPALREAIERSIAELVATGIERQALNVGGTAPDFALPNQHGETITLSSLLRRGPVVVSFYRGGWCPFCNLELKALQERLADFRRLGAELVAISPELPDRAAMTAKENAIDFSVLSDMGNRYAKACSLVFKLPDFLRPVYGDMEHHFIEHNGDDSLTLPIPATYVVGQDRKVQFAYIYADYLQRCEPQDVVDMLGKMGANAKP